jgi:hypothetical protein
MVVHGLNSDDEHTVRMENENRSTAVYGVNE